MKLTITIEYTVDSHDAGRSLVNRVMPVVYNAGVGATPDEWMWDVTAEDEDDDG